MTLEEIKALDAGFYGKFGEKYIGQGIRVPTLQDCANWFTESVRLWLSA